MNYIVTRIGLYSKRTGGYKFEWRDVLRWLGHLPIGGLIGYLIMAVDPYLGMTAGVFFLAYEALEDWRCRDRSFKDVFGAMLALIAVGLAIKIWPGLEFALFWPNMS